MVGWTSPVCSAFVSASVALDLLVGESKAIGLFHVGNGLSPMVGSRTTFHH